MQCSNLAKDSLVISSELYDNPNDHFVLAYGPVAQRNHFQAMLYSAQNEFNVSILPVHDVGIFGEIPWPGKLVCHFHWIHDKTKNAKTELEADLAVLYWENLLHRIKENGHKIVWTVHNVLPHESEWVNQDIRIHQMMADAADALHVMATDTAKLTAPYYKLDERKIFVLPHPIYHGEQPDVISRVEARAELNIKGEEVLVFLSFGAIMEYKGYERLMAAYDLLRAKNVRQTSLIIAGLPSNKELVGKITKWAEGKLDVILDMSAVPNDKLQIYFRSADIAVCPYHRTMNSGVAMLAITFDLPVLGPNSGVFLDLESKGCGVTFENENDTALFDKMYSIALNEPIERDQLISSKMDLMPYVLSESFFKIVGRLNNKTT